MDRTRLPAKGRCQGSAWSTLDVRQANSALGVLTICAKFGSTVLIVKPSIIKCFKVGIVAFTHRAIERSVESCTRCADAEQLLDGCCSRLNSGWSLLSEISVVVRRLTNQGTISGQESNEEDCRASRIHQGRCKGVARSLKDEDAGR